MAVECKRHSTAVAVTHIDKFVGMLLDLPVDSGVFYAFGPVTPGARQRAANARHPKISMKELAGEALFPPWSDNLEEISPWGTCRAPNCRAGEIWWQTFVQDDGTDAIEAGSCDYCGTWTVKCRDCGEEEYAFSTDVTCMTCGAGYELTSSDYQSNNWDGVVQTSKGHD
ncbi:restriction endonuclease [Microbacterium sp. C7(2022)]|uniref:restriction endonuclease n=1 Tax=Microbacterium sp. C7(2022) TaxID=2992759 RepID=UPI00237C30F3|nr:restriction endonuclease [Microbacterium sp. C7(2022)]MDE0547674.1 restriction endonuclease [Microbacterium sp. C7(2022)]